MKLLTLSAKVKFEQCGVQDKYTANKIFNYCMFLEQPLTLGQFVPCKDGKPLNEPKDYKDFKSFTVGYLDYNPKPKQYKEWHEYEQAQKAVLFKGFEYCKQHRQVTSKQIIITFGDKRVFLDHPVDSNIYYGQVLNSPTVSKIAEATQENPIELNESN